MSSMNDVFFLILIFYYFFEFYCIRTFKVMLNISNSRSILPVS